VTLAENGWRSVARQARTDSWGLAERRPGLIGAGSPADHLRVIKLAGEWLRRHAANQRFFFSSVYSTLVGPRRCAGNTGAWRTYIGAFAAPDHSCRPSLIKIRA